MKKAKVVKDIVQKVWPTAKGKPFPSHMYPKPHYDWLVEVPDDVQPGWVWDGEKYAPKKKPPINAFAGRQWVLEVICELLGTTYADVKAEAKKRKLDAIRSLSD